MDRSHLEPCYRLQQSISWLFALLRGAYGRPPAGDGPEQLPEWVCCNLSSTDARYAEAVEEASVDLCEFDG